jgi:hypothetical protein
MSLISNGIDSVRAFALPGGIWPNGESVNTPHVAFVKWRSVLKEVLYQIYVNGKFAGSTVHFEQKQMIVPIPASFTCAIKIEVFAVLPKYADVDLSSEFCGSYDNGRVKIIMSRTQNLPADATLQIYFDNGTGQIDYDNPFEDKSLQIWPSWQDKAGFGMSRFGCVDFGYDSSAAVGFGKGCFGINEFGIDVDVIQWVSPSLQAGVYKFAIVVYDKNGNASISAETDPITVTPEAEPAKALQILSFDKQSNELILKIT